MIVHSLNIHEVEEVRAGEFTFAPRLNLLCGTSETARLVLDTIHWFCTRRWAHSMPSPRQFDPSSEKQLGWADTQLTISLWYPSPSGDHTIEVQGQWHKVKQASPGTPGEIEEHCWQTAKLDRSVPHGHEPPTLFVFAEWFPMAQVRLVALEQLDQVTQEVTRLRMTGIGLPRSQSAPDAPLVLLLDGCDLGSDTSDLEAPIAALFSEIRRLAPLMTLQVIAILPSRFVTTQIAQHPLVQPNDAIVPLEPTSPGVYQAGPSLVSSQENWRSFFGDDGQ
jgi:hypothetical protein